MRRVLKIRPSLIDGSGRFTSDTLARQTSTAVLTIIEGRTRFVV